MTKKPGQIIRFNFTDEKEESVNDEIVPPEVNIEASATATATVCASKMNISILFSLLQLAHTSQGLSIKCKSHNYLI